MSDEGVIKYLPTDKRKVFLALFGGVDLPLL
jgi:hypothetical protein